jgi:CRISPR-associated protein Csm5
MRYSATALTPLLVGDGRELSPIDYMVWKDQVNVLDQPRIFRLLSRGPRLDGYLAQLRKAEKLDFASWGGFAQNFSARRIPFEHSSSTSVWEKTAAEHLFIPTFAANHQGPYLPGSSLKGALRTGLIASRWSASTAEKLAAHAAERFGRRASEHAEAGAGAGQLRIVAAGDSDAVAKTSFKVFLTRTANIDGRAGAAQAITWKTAGRGNVPSARMTESTPTFVEMAVPGTSFSGEYFERKFLEDEQLVKALGWRSRPDLPMLAKAANEFAEAQIEQHAKFAEIAGFAKLRESIASLRHELENIGSTQNTCLLCLGWGGGFLSKSSFKDTAEPNFQTLLKSVPAFGRALKGDAAFPKTRRVIFSGGQPAHLAGWVRVEFEADKKNIF